MNFYERVKSDIVEYRNNVGYRSNVVVDWCALRLLIEDYERLDQIIRAEKIPAMTLGHFESMVKSVFFENKKDCGKVFILISDILKPLIEENERRDRLEREYKK